MLAVCRFGWLAGSIRRLLMLVSFAFIKQKFIYKNIEAGIVASPAICVVRSSLSRSSTAQNEDSTRRLTMRVIVRFIAFTLRQMCQNSEWGNSSVLRNHSRDLSPLVVAGAPGRPKWRTFTPVRKAE